MRYPRWSHILTKGFTAVRKGISLITKGILDQKLGSKPIPFQHVRAFDIQFIVQGRKQYEYKDIYAIIGKKQFSYIEILNIIGKKTLELEKTITARALIAQQFALSFNLTGKKQNTVDELLMTVGNKNFNFDKKYKTLGNKEYDYYNTKNLVASKKYNYNVKKEFIGNKKLDIDSNLNIKGKKDITNILVAVGLLK